MNHGKIFWFSGMGTSIIVGSGYGTGGAWSCECFRVKDIVVTIRSMLDTDSKD